MRIFKLVVMPLVFGATVAACGFTLANWRFWVIVILASIWATLPGEGD